MQSSNINKMPLPDFESLSQVSENMQLYEDIKVCADLTKAQTFKMYDNPCPNMYNERILEIMRAVTISTSESTNSITVCCPNTILEHLGEPLRDGKYTPLELMNKINLDPKYQQQLFRANKVILKPDYMPHITGIERDLVQHTFQVKANSISAASQVRADVLHPGGSRKRWITAIFIGNAIFETCFKP